MTPPDDLWESKGSRVADVDIYDVARFNTAVVHDFSAVADEAGETVVRFETMVDNAKLSGIEVLVGTSAPHVI